MRPIPSMYYPFIRSVEDVKLWEYTDQAGIKTIYVGHIVKPGEVYTHTIEDADKYLELDTNWRAAVVSNATEKLWLTDNEYAALISFTFNAGTHAFLTSTLYQLLEKGDKQGAANQFLAWDKVRNPVTGKLEKSEGLLNRRIAERKLFLGVDK